MKPEESVSECYRQSQRALSDLKAAVFQLIEMSDSQGLTNSQIGRMLGIYQGHVGHEGHIPRTLLAIMESEGVVEQDQNTKRWRIRRHSDGEDAHKHA